jgi:hypothetical protein
MMRYLKYTHPASMGYDLNKSYKLEDLKKELELEVIQVLFTPINFQWEKASYNKKIKQENIQEKD